MEEQFNRQKNLIKNKIKDNHKENFKFLVDVNYRNKIEIKLEDLDDYLIGLFYGFFINIFIFPLELIFFKKQSNELRIGKFHGIALLTFFLFLLFTLKIFSLYSNLFLKLEKLFKNN